MSYTSSIEYAKQVINQWEDHDKFRITEADKEFLVNGRPPEVNFALDFLALYVDYLRGTPGV